MTRPGTPVTIKRYARQRLYDTVAGAYVTLVLKQIILERGAHG